MIFSRRKKQPEGQAMTEMIIVIPILSLLMAGIIQFAILFLSYVQFEHACGESARQYAAGMIDENSLNNVIFDNLGHFKIYFDEDSLTVTRQEPKSTAGAVLDETMAAIRFIPFVTNYEGYEWSINIRCKPPFFARILFPDGLPLHTVMQVYRYTK
jgi:hypothetical protein